MTLGGSAVLDSLKQRYSIPVRSKQKCCQPSKPAVKSVTAMCAA
jgi:hypothetical protein